MSKVAEGKFEKYFNNESFLEAALVAVEAARMLQEQERTWLRKLFAAAVKYGNRELVDAIAPILNAANPTNYSQLNQVVMEAIINNNKQAP